MIPVIGYFSESYGTVTIYCYTPDGEKLYCTRYLRREAIRDMKKILKKHNYKLELN